MNLVLIGCDSRGLPFRAHDGQGLDVMALKPGEENDYELLHRASKTSDLIVVCGCERSSHLVADEIWHLLRNKIIISLSEGVSLSTLREMYPLSKVSRCRMYIDAGIDKTLSLYSYDSSYSDKDLSLVRDVLGRVGEVLFVKEETMERLGLEMDTSIKIIREVVKALSDSSEVDRDLFEYAMSWALYGLGLAGVKDLELPALTEDQQMIEHEVLSKLRKLIREAIAARKLREQGR